MTKTEIDEKLQELFIRFNTSPKLYQKRDYLELLKFLKDLLSNSDYGALHEEDLKTINKESIVGEGDLSIDVDRLQKITYSELVELRDNSKLVPGMWYQITDYVTTSTESETECAGHLFDIVVIANSNNTLSELAKACQHDGEDYFQNSNLEAWTLKYCLDNDVDRFGWADEENGKGVIYRLTDERNNSCPYDFKNIKFRYNLGDQSSRCVYTFSLGAAAYTPQTEWGNDIDFSMSDIYYVYNNYVDDNHMKVFHGDQYIAGSGGTSASGYINGNICLHTDILQLPFIYFVGPMTVGSFIAADSCYLQFVPNRDFLGNSAPSRKSYISTVAVQGVVGIYSVYPRSWYGISVATGNSVSLSV